MCHFAEIYDAFPFHHALATDSQSIRVTWLNVGHVKALAHIYPLRVTPAFYLQATLPYAHVFEHYTSL